MEDDVVTVKIDQHCDVRMAGISIIGTRGYQQDTYYMTSNRFGSLAVICDGMGGMEHGELASRKAVELLVSDFEELTQLDDPSEFLYCEAVKMDEQVAMLTDEDGNVMDAGTTLVAVLVVENAAYWISVGDSRIYIIRNDEIFPVTRLHNYRFRLNEKLERQEITMEEYEEEEKQAEALISYIGMNGLELVDRNMLPFGMQCFDRILLCSDGLYKVLSEEEIMEVVHENHMDLRKIPSELMKCVENSGRKQLDNTTVILMSYE